MPYAFCDVRSILKSSLPDMLAGASRTTNKHLSSLPRRGIKDHKQARQTLTVSFPGQTLVRRKKPLTNLESNLRFDSRFV